MAQTFNKSFIHDNIARTYEIYLPQNYTGTTSVPLILNFHGFSSNGTQQSLFTNFQAIADSAGFIVAHPTGTLLSGFIPHWNVGGFTSSSTVDDVSYTSALIDTIAAIYNIDMMRVYACGLSNGGFFSHKLACELGNRIAAIASVVGTFTPAMQLACNPAHPTPVLQIHGTADSTVPYNGQVVNGGMASVDSVINYWVTYNNCNTTPAVFTLPNINTMDGSTVERYIYAGGDAGLSVELLKVINGGHEWPGAFGNMDINASLEIWKFFSRYSNTAVDVKDVFNKKLDIQIFPNPAASFLSVTNSESKNLTYKIFSIQGSYIKSGELKGISNQIDITDLPSNMYMLQVKNQIFKFIKSN